MKYGDDILTTDITTSLKDFSRELFGDECSYSKGLDAALEMLNVILDNNVPEMTNSEFKLLQGVLILDIIRYEEKIKRPFVTVFKSVMVKGDLAERLAGAPIWFIHEARNWSNIQQVAAMWKVYKNFNVG